MKTNRPPALILESPTSCCGARIWFYALEFTNVRVVKTKNA